MTNERNAFKAGLFIIVSIALIFFVTVMIKGVNRFTNASVERAVRFTLTDNIGGLRIGDDVREGGMRVGVVKAVNLVPESDGTQKIVVWFTIPQSVPLHKNARIVIESTITGTANLNIDNIGDGAILAANDELVGSPGAFATLMANAGDLMPMVKGTLNDVRTQTVPRLNSTLDSGKATLEKFGGTADTGKEALAHIRDIFGDTKTDIRQTMKNLNSATGTIDKKLPGVMDNLNIVLDKAKGTVDGVNVALEDVKKTVANTRDISASARSVVSGNKSKLDGMIASLKTASDNLKNATAELRHNPWRLLYKPTPGEVSNLSLYDSARQFAEGANSLNDAASALRDAVKNPNADQKQVQTLLDQLDKKFNNFTQVEAELWKSVKQ
jgi:ABC-type transporter Mla subunit MlaD